MRRADRLFQIIQILRRARKPTPAAAIAAELETSVRTVYRDVAALVGQRAPIRGEAGIGYVLEAGHDLPPLMLTPDEIEAAVIGAQWVATRGDPALTRAAHDLIAKIGASLPKQLQTYVLEPVGRVSSWRTVPDRLDMAATRRAIQQRRKIVLDYADEQNRRTQRTVWPFAIAYLDAARLLVAWCETRRDFRHFRTDRVEGAVFLDESYPDSTASLHARWKQRLQEQVAARSRDFAAE